MFALDNRAGNVITTVAVFATAAAILYLARLAFLILLLSILFAYLLDPAVTWVRQRSPLGRGNRNLAIAQVFLVGMLVLGSLGYELGRPVGAQIKTLSAALPEIVENLSSGKAAPEKVGRHELSVVEQLRIQDLLTRHQDFLRQVLQRGTASATSVAKRAVWLLAVPVLAAFILIDGRRILDAIIQAGERQGKQTAVKRILDRVDTMLAQYMRAQLALAGLAFGFYTISMFLLRFPSAFALGALGGMLEFIPIVGCVASAMAILTVGFLTHSHWIWMAGLLVVWRIVQDYVNSPRIMSGHVKLPQLAVIFGLMVGSQVAGIAGAYLSVPAIAILRIVWLEYFSGEEPSPALASEPLTQVKPWVGASE